MASKSIPSFFHAHQVLGNFSVDNESVYRDDQRMRRIFVEPDEDVRSMNLLEGIDDYEGQASLISGQGEQPSSMTPLLEWMRDHRGELVEHDILKRSENGNDIRLDIDFVGRRGVFCLLLSAMETSKFYRLEVLVTLCNGTYYIELMKDADNKIASKETQYCLKNFTRHVTLVDGAPPDITSDDNAYYSAVMKTQCGHQKIVFSSGIDAERDDSDKHPPRNYIDIKLRNNITSDHAEGNFGRYTALKWWSQAVIAGIPEILCGWRDNENEKSTLSSIELMKTDEFPQRAPVQPNGKRFWEPEACYDTFHTLLANIKDLIKEDNPKMVHRLELPDVQKGPGIRKRLQVRRFKLLGSREDDYVILPDWYLRDFLKIHDHDQNV